MDVKLEEVLEWSKLDNVQILVKQSTDADKQWIVGWKAVMIITL